MPWPPIYPGAGRLNSTPQFDNHPADHNEIDQALRDIVSRWTVHERLTGQTVLGPQQSTAQYVGQANFAFPFTKAAPWDAYADISVSAYIGYGGTTGKYGIFYYSDAVTAPDGSGGWTFGPADEAGLGPTDWGRPRTVTAVVPVNINTVPLFVARLYWGGQSFPAGPYPDHSYLSYNITSTMHPRV